MTRFDTWLTTQPELPEECPQCGEPNADENGDWLAPDAVPFCSTKCQVAYDEANPEPEWEPS